MQHHTTLPDTPIGALDRTLLLVGFAGGFRRSELVGIDIEHVEPMPNGIAVLLPKSKTEPTLDNSRMRDRGSKVRASHPEKAARIVQPAQPVPTRTRCRPCCIVVGYTLWNVKSVKQGACRPTEFCAP